MQALFLTPGATYRFTYCNHRQEIAERTVKFESAAYGEFPFHEHKCWVLNGLCLDRNQRRTFELGRIADDIVRIST